MVAAEWPWKRVIYANLHPLVDNFKSYVVDSGIDLSLFFFANINEQDFSQYQSSNARDAKG
jgi:hypothetical protein